MNKISGNADNIRNIFDKSKFSLDYYQREYRWKKAQINELLNDLSGKFLKDHKEGNDRRAIEHYDYYFLGSIIISYKKGEQYIIDGQQRLTSLILLLICIFHKLKEQGQRVPSYLENLIYFEQYEKYSYKLDVPEREKCMNSLRSGEPINGEGESASIKNIIARYNDIEELFPDVLEGEALPYFTDWLIERVYLVQIKTYSDSDSDVEAYTIFETMNDRGLSLTPTEMLKGYLLSRITDNKAREKADKDWKKQIASLQDIDKGEDANTIKAWLRSQYAQNIRKRDKGADPRDFDLIGSEFHRWVRTNEQNVGLSKSCDFARFIQDDFIFYGKWYKFIRDSAKDFNYAKKQQVEAIHYNAHNNFTLQHTVLLAPLKKADNDNDIRLKLRIVSLFLDILIARRIWNYQSIAYSTMQYNMFLLIQDIRYCKNIDGDGGLIDILTQRLEDMKETYESLKTFGLHSRNTPRVRYLLARMTDYVQTQSGGTSHYDDYINYEVEHIWADQYEKHGYDKEFEHVHDFSEYRNRIGGLLLLPKSPNASYGSLPYHADSQDEKRKHYLKENLLAASLHEEAYDHNPGFVRFNDKFKRNSGLEAFQGFQAHPEFKKKDLDERQDLYRELCKQIWNPEKLKDM